MAEDKKKSGPKPGAKAKPAGAKVESETAEEFEGGSQTISLFLAVGLIVSALIVGLVVGYVVAPKSAVSDLGATPSGNTAPALTQDQINSQQLPPSHPPLPGAGESSAAKSAGDGESSTSETPKGEKSEQ